MRLSPLITSLLLVFTFAITLPALVLSQETQSGKHLTYGELLTIEKSKRTRVRAGRRQYAGT
jgi:hypothetical protein